MRAIRRVTRVRPQRPPSTHLIASRYRLHNDWFNPAEAGYTDKICNGGQRRISVFIYLQVRGPEPSALSAGFRVLFPATFPVDY